MKLRAILLALTSMLLLLPAFAAEKKITLTDPAGDVAGDDTDPAPSDIVSVDLSSDGEFVIIAVTLSAPRKPASLFQALVAGVAFDIDNSSKTGGQGFAGGYGNVPGIDFESEIFSSTEDGAESKTASASVIAVDAKGNQSSVVYASDAPSTPAKGKTYTGKITYASMGVKSGQTIRAIVRELNDRGEKSGMFEPALLTLQ